MNAIILSAILGVIMMFSGIWVNNKATLRWIALAGLLVLLISNIAEMYGYRIWNVNVHNMLYFDRFGLLFNSIAIGSTFIFVALSGSDINRVGKYAAEYYTLIFFVLTGITIISVYTSLLMLFLGIEIMSIPLYILTGSDKRNLKSNEASLKYFLMGAFSTGLMLMGITLIYGATGSFSIEVVNNPAIAQGVSFLEIMGMLFLLVSMAFKVSAAPFHFWTPDVYDGAPGVFTSFMATVVKAAAFVAFVKLFDARMSYSSAVVDWKMLLCILIIATLLIGNITAVFQQSVKRMLAYSSIAQAGFMLFAVFSMNEMAKEGMIFYAVSYSLATIGVFAVLLKMKDFTFEGYNGLAKSQPILAFANTVFLLSLAGIPLTAGFFAKYFMLASVIQTGHYLWMVIVAVLFAAVSVYYYFRVIQAMYFKTGEGETENVHSGFKTGLIILTVIIILLGVAPNLIINFLYF